eukprot:5664794-Pyramimonas_sp.AAC.1
MDWEVLVWVSALVWAGGLPIGIQLEASRLESNRNSNKKALSELNQISLAKDSTICSWECRSCAGWWRTHAGGATGTFGGAPYGATKRCTGWVRR